MWVCIIMGACYTWHAIHGELSLYHVIHGELSLWDLKMGSLVAQPLPYHYMMQMVHMLAKSEATMDSLLFPLEK